MKISPSTELAVVQEPPRFRSISFGSGGNSKLVRFPFPWTIHVFQYGKLQTFFSQKPIGPDFQYFGIPPLPHIRYTGEVCLLGPAVANSFYSTSFNPYHGVGHSAFPLNVFVPFDPICPIKFNDPSRFAYIYDGSLLFYNEDWAEKFSKWVSMNSIPDTLPHYETWRQMSLADVLKVTWLKADLTDLESAIFLSAYKYPDVVVPER